jgi:hypothetical protein
VVSTEIAKHPTLLLSLFQSSFRYIHQGLFIFLNNFYEFLAVIYVGLACAAIDPLIVGLICQATGQLEVLKENLQHLDDHVDKKIAKLYDEQASYIKCNFIYGRIKECVLHYNIIIR